jgi:glutaredoxin-dependent peroxiredoxin
LEIKNSSYTFAICEKHVFVFCKNFHSNIKKINKKMSISIGQKAPNFELFDSEKNKVSLSSYAGKNVVVLFFPLAFTGVCTTEMCTMRDGLASFNSMNAEVVAISVDSLFVLDKFKKENDLNFPLLSDFNKEASKAYDSLYDVFPAFEMQGVSKRSAFVVNTEGNITYAEYCATPGDQPNYEAIKAILA